MPACDHRALLRPMLLALPVVFAGTLFAEEKEPPPPPPIRALLVTGGCSHDYQVRQEVLTRGIRERVARPIEWVVRMQGVGESDVRIPLFESAEWAKDCDIVVHDHCFPRVRDTAYVDRVLAPHRAGLPAVLLHGTMMSFRTGDERWFDFTGLTTRSHERERAVRVEAIAPVHPILKGFGPWEIPREELYRAENLKSGAVALARSLDPAGQAHTSIWTHRYGPAQARVFGTTLGNATSTVADAKYLDLIARGFLWSLGELSETSFRVVPEADSLKGFEPEIPASPLPKPGGNAVREGEVSAFSWGATAAPEAIALTNDGDPATAWSAVTPGPGAWTVSWQDPREVGAVVVYWKGSGPKEARLEGTRDGRTWQGLSRLTPSEEAKTPELVRIAPSKYRGLRISVDAMPPGGRIGLREVAAYDSVASVPAAILAMRPAASSGAQLRPAGTDDFLSRIQLAPGWKVAREGLVPVSGEVSQIIPTVPGAVFLTVFPEAGESGSVYRISPEGESGFAVEIYLAKIESGSHIAWDGEWLYTLSGHRLERVRRALGNGPADERQRFEALYTLPGEGAPKGAVVTGLEFGLDGWLWAKVASEEAGFVISREGRRISWPLDGRLRFSPLGRGLTSERVLPMAQSDALPDGGRVEGTYLRADDGPLVWLMGAEAGQQRLVGLTNDSFQDGARRDWNEVETKHLAEFLAPASDRPTTSIRFEAAMEMLRRKRAGVGDVPRLLAGSDLPDDLASLLVTASSGAPSVSPIAHLERLASHPDPAVQAAAYLAIGDQRTPPHGTAFAALGSVTIPEVSAAILDALRRSGASLPGAETVAMSLANHENERLAAAAHDFLVDRGSIEPALQTLDREELKYWPGALAVLAALPSEVVVGGLIGRLDRSVDPEFRRQGLETLASLYPARSRVSRTWEQSGRISDYFLRCLSDHRIDAAAAIRSMQAHGLPEPCSELLFKLGQRDFQLETYAIDGLIKTGSTELPDGAMPWIRLLSRDKSRDPDFRRKALALLAKHGPTDEYRLWFSETAKAIDDLPEVESTGLVRANWLGRGDHAANRDWLKTQTRQRNARMRGLAWSSLMAGLLPEGLSEEDRTSLGATFAEAIKSGGDDVDAEVLEIGSAPLDVVGVFLKTMGGSSDPGVKMIATQVASTRGLDPLKGTPTKSIDVVETATLVQVVESGGGDLVAGGLIFRTRGCIECHNPHGEGPGPGPDLSTVLKDRSLAEWIESMVMPDARVAPGYELMSVSLPSAGDLLAWGETRDGANSEWIDRAGNQFQVQPTAKFEKRNRGTPCGRSDASLEQAELSDLAAFLRSLAR